MSKKKKNKKDKVFLDPQFEFTDGDHVKLNVDRIRGHPDYKTLTFAYRHFIDLNEDTVFEITSEENVFGIKGLYLLKDGDTIHKWLVYGDNLIRIDSEVVA